MSTIPSSCCFRKLVSWVGDRGCVAGPPSKGLFVPALSPSALKRSGVRYETYGWCIRKGFQVGERGRRTARAGFRRHAVVGGDDLYSGTSTNGGTTITTEATGSTPDALPITWNGTVAGLGVGVSAADVQPSDPRLGSTDLSGSTSTSSSGTIWVFVSETGLTSSSAMKTLTSYFADNVIPSGRA